MENAFGILASRFRVLLSQWSIGQRSETLFCQNKQVDDNYRIPFREAKHQRDLLKDYFNHLGTFAGLGSEIYQATILGTEDAGIYQSVSGLPNYSKNFYSS